MECADKTHNEEQLELFQLFPQNQVFLHVPSPAKDLRWQCKTTLCFVLFTNRHESYRTRTSENLEAITIFVSSRNSALDTEMLLNACPRGS
jgi:hypothetical protein